MAHLQRVVLPVRDIEQAARFYAAVLRVPPGPHYFECEGTILACFDLQADGEGSAAKANNGAASSARPSSRRPW